MATPTVEIYAKKGCCLCKEAKKIVVKVNGEIPFVCKEVDIASSEDLLRRYTGHVPTIFINGKKAFKFKIDEGEFRRRVRKEIIRSSISKLSVAKAASEAKKPAKTRN